MYERHANNNVHIKELIEKHAHAHTMYTIIIWLNTTPLIVAATDTSIVIILTLTSDLLAFLNLR